MIHYQLPATADTYIHRSGRTARAGEDGISISLVTPGEAPRWAALVRALARPQPMAAFPVDRTLMPQVGGGKWGVIWACPPELLITPRPSMQVHTRPKSELFPGFPSPCMQVHTRVKLAMKLDDVLRAERKHRAESAWARNNAEAADLDLDDGVISESDGDDDGDGEGAKVGGWLAGGSSFWTLHLEPLSAGPLSLLIQILLSLYLRQDSASRSLLLSPLRPSATICPPVLLVNFPSPSSLPSPLSPKAVICLLVSPLNCPSPSSFCPAQPKGSAARALQAQLAQLLAAPLAPKMSGLYFTGGAAAAVAHGAGLRAATGPAEHADSAQVAVPTETLNKVRV